MKAVEFCKKYDFIIQLPLATKLLSRHMYLYSIRFWRVNMEIKDHWCGGKYNK